MSNSPTASQENALPEAKSTRIDQAHPLMNAGKSTQPTPWMAMAGRDPSETESQLQREADELRAVLKQGSADQPQATLNARLAKLDHELRAARMREIVNSGTDLLESSDVQNGGSSVDYRLPTWNTVDRTDERPAFDQPKSDQTTSDQPTAFQPTAVSDEPARRRPVANVEMPAESSQPPQSAIAQKYREDLESTSAVESQHRSAETDQPAAFYDALEKAMEREERETTAHGEFFHATMPNSETPKNTAGDYDDDRYATASNGSSSNGSSRSRTSRPSEPPAEFPEFLRTDFPAFAEATHPDPLTSDWDLDRLDLPELPTSHATAYSATLHPNKSNRDLDAMVSSLDGALESEKRLLMERKIELDRRKAVLRQTQDEAQAMHSEALEMRLITEQLWAKMSGQHDSAQLQALLNSLRQRLESHYGTIKQTLEQRHSELLALRDRVANQQKSLQAQSQKLQEWARARQESIRTTESQLSSREMLLDRREHRLREEFAEWETQRKSYREQLDGLLRKLNLAGLTE